MVKFKPKKTKGFISNKFEKENPPPDTLAEAMKVDKKGRKVLSVTETGEHVDIITKDGRRQRVKK